MNYIFVRFVTAIVSLAPVMLAAAEEAKPAASPRTFCNPLNLDYKFVGNSYRHGADPVVVLFKDKYYLFSTWEGGGYRVSDDLLNWTFIPFTPDSAPFVTNKTGVYTAPAVGEIDGALYFINFGNGQDLAGKPYTTFVVARSTDPLSGKWEKVSDIPKLFDPTFFTDPATGRVYVYHACGPGGPIEVSELDRATFTVIAGSTRVLRGKIATPEEFDGGWERRAESFLPGSRLPDLKDPKVSFVEAPWVTERSGKYYMQYASAGTRSNWYSDGLFVADSTLGPFQPVPYGPISHKPGGFVGGAGHSCVFRDKHGNWWEISTMWVGVKSPWERRLGLFPVVFDDDGMMRTLTRFGDYPMVLPDGPRDDSRSPLAGWWVLSSGKKATASSSLPAHGPGLAADEDIRTWWSAATGDAGEWLQIDLGKTCRVEAVQVNFTEQDAKPQGSSPPDDYHQYRLLGSSDGEAWNVLIDRSQSRAATPHDYHPLAHAKELRHLRLENIHTACGGKFAISDLRVFGNELGKPPAQVKTFKAVRDASDPRNVMLEWAPVADADGYLIQYGVDPLRLNLTYQTDRTSPAQIKLHTLTRGQPYTFRIDTFNGSGVTEGPVVAVP